MHMLCDKPYPGEMPQAHLFTANRPKHEYHLSPTWWTRSFNAVTHRSTGDELLVGTSNTDVSPKPTSTWLTAQESGNLEHTSQPAGSTVWWRVPFQVLRLKACFAAWCVWEELSALLAYSCQGEPMSWITLADFLKLFWVVYISGSGASLQDETVIQQHDKQMAMGHQDNTGVLAWNDHRVSNVRLSQGHCLRVIIAVTKSNMGR